MASPRRTMTRTFRKRMLRQAIAIFGGLIAVLMLLVGTVDHRIFLITAMVLVPISALMFNFLQRRAYAFYQGSSQVSNNKRGTP